MASVYLKRFRRRVLLVNCGKPRALWIPKTRNLIGFPEGISGQELIARLNRHVFSLGVERCRGEAIVKRFHNGFRVRIETETFTSRTVILATGLKDRQPALENLNQLRATGLLRYCPVCDAFDYRNEIISVLADDDHGLQKAAWLRTFSPRVQAFIPQSLKLAPVRIRELKQLRIKIFRGTIKSIQPSRSPPGVWVHRERGAPVFSRVIYPMLGCDLNDSAYASLRGLARTKEGFIIATTEQRTSIPGLFAVGDCVNLLAQISVASGQAAVAATTIHNDLC